MSGQAEELKALWDEVQEGEFASSIYGLAYTHAYDILDAANCAAAFHLKLGERGWLHEDIEDRLKWLIADIAKFYSVTWEQVASQLNKEGPATNKNARHYLAATLAWAAQLMAAELNNSTTPTDTLMTATAALHALDAIRKENQK